MNTNDYATCPGCGHYGPVALLGNLGTLWWARCRWCGCDYNLAREVPHFDRVVAYGGGEPLGHPDVELSPEDFV